MRPQPRELLNFLLRKFDGLKTLFEVGLQQSYIIEPSLFNKISGENDLDEGELLKFGFLKMQPNGYYKLEKNYTDFLEFLFKKSALELPEKFNGYTENISELFLKIRTHTEQPKEILKYTVNSLIDEIENFVGDIEQQTNQLLSDTDALKHNPDNLTDLRERVKTATLWIDNFIKPLNITLNPQSSNSIINHINQISRYANDKKLFEKDLEVAQWFERLYSQSQYADDELKRSANRIVRELIPLLDRIRESSRILSGFYYFLENEENKEQQPVNYLPIISKLRRFAYSQDSAAKAEMLVDTFFIEQEAQQFEYETTETEFWIPDSVHFKEELFNALPIDNFYEWCYGFLKNETVSVNSYKFFTIAKLILEEELKIEYQPGRFDIELEDAIMSVPIVKAYERIS